jgi:hypothetical protein
MEREWRSIASDHADAEFLTALSGRVGYYAIESYSGEACAMPIE